MNMVLGSSVQSMFIFGMNAACLLQLRVRGYNVIVLPNFQVEKSAVHSQTI